MDGAKAYHLGISLGIAFLANADSVLRNHRVSSWMKKVGSLVTSNYFGSNILSEEFLWVVRVKITITIKIFLSNCYWDKSRFA